MERQSSQLKDLKFREVCLSDLRSIMALYQENKSDNIHADSALELTEHFGLPLYLLEIEKRLIGYSFVTVNRYGQSEIHLQIDKEFEKKKIGEKLLQYTVQSRHEVFRLNDRPAFSDIAGIKRSVAALVRWLNLCDD